MARPGVHVDEDWEIHLLDIYEDDAWEADDSQKKRFYVEKCAFERRDPVTGRDTSLRISSGRIRLPKPPTRYLTYLDCNINIIKLLEHFFNNWDIKKLFNFYLFVEVLHS